MLLRSIIDFYFLNNNSTLKSLNNFLLSARSKIKSSSEYFCAEWSFLVKLEKETNDAAIKGISSLSRLEKENIAIRDKIVRDIKNLFTLEKENKAINYRILRDIWIFEYEEEHFYKSVRIGNFWSNNFIKHKSNGDKNRTLSIKKYLHKISPYLKDIISNHKKSDTQKIQLTITINFISSKQDNDEELAMHSKWDNIEIIINDRADEVIKELFESLNKYNSNLETKMWFSEFVFKYVHLLYYKCHKINRYCGGLYIDFPDWIKNKKGIINPINKKDNKCFQYTVTIEKS